MLRSGKSLTFKGTQLYFKIRMDCTKNKLPSSQTSKISFSNGHLSSSFFIVSLNIICPVPDKAINPYFPFLF